MDQICGLVPIGKASELGAHDSHDFSTFSADVVVVNLGTNDAGAYSDTSHECAKNMGFNNTHRLNEVTIQGLLVAGCRDGTKLTLYIYFFLLRFLASGSISGDCSIILLSSAGLWLFATLSK